jgi:hypothetical protein
MCYMIESWFKCDERLKFVSLKNHLFGTEFGNINFWWTWYSEREPVSISALFIRRETCFKTDESLEELYC